jgi:hypothetical protein
VWGFGSIGVGFGSIGVGFGFIAGGGGNIAVGLVGCPAAGDTGEAEGVSELWEAAVAKDALAGCCLLLSWSFWRQKRQPSPKNRIQKTICLITGGHKPQQSSQNRARDADNSGEKSVLTFCTDTRAKFVRYRLSGLSHPRSVCRKPLISSGRIHNDSTTSPLELDGFKPSSSHSRNAGDLSWSKRNLWREMKFPPKSDSQFLRQCDRKILQTRNS